MDWWAVALVLPAVFIAVGDWRNGLFAMLVIGFLQDPARKLEEGRPVYFTLLVGVVFAAAYVKAQIHTRFVPTQIPGWKQYIGFPAALFALILVAQAGHSIARYGNPIMAGIGAMSYLAPLPALLAGYHFAVKGGHGGIERWLVWYLVIAIISLTSILLEFAGVEWRVLGDVGVGLWLHQGGTALTANSGFFRASEVAAWHTAAAVSILLLLASLRRVTTTRTIASVAIVAALLAIGVLTGRRKIFVEIVIFLCIYVALMLQFRKGGTKMAMALAVSSLLTLGAVNLWVGEPPGDYFAAGDVRYQRFVERGASVGGDVSERFLDLGIAPIGWAIDQFGWLGGGLGIGSQGAQHFGGGAEVFGGASEGGLGKITAELGVAGLLIASWLLVASVRYGWQVLVFVSTKSSATARLCFGLIAFLLANLAVFTIATQIFGDLFILLMLGLMGGFFMATPVLAMREHADLQQPIEAAPQSSDRLV